MPLSDEQRSLLQLLLEGGQGYEDIGSLLGVGPDEVRSRVRAALTEIGGADPDAQVAVSDFLLGKADPIGRADAVRHLQNDPEANALAARLLSQLRLLAPRAELPQIPEPRGRGAPAPPSAPSPAAAPPTETSVPPSVPPGVSPPAPPAPDAPPPPGGREPISSRVSGALSGVGGGDPKRRSQVLVGLGALAILIVGGVLAITGVFGGDDDGGGTETTASTPSDPDLVIVQLSPLDSGSSATGQATFAQADDQAVVQLNLSGLEPAQGDKAYVSWLYNSDRVAFPVGFFQADQSGNFTGPAPIPQQLLGAIGQFGCVDVSLIDGNKAASDIQQAIEQNKLPPHSGNTVLRGQIPTQPGQDAPTGADSQCDVAPAAGGGGGGTGGGGTGGGGAGSGAGQ